MLTSIKNTFFIACQYVLFHKIRSAALVAALAIIILVPLFFEIVFLQTQTKLTERAKTTPLILGTAGSSLDLAINALYFITKSPEGLAMSDTQTIDDSELAYSIPLHTRFKAGKYPVIGTTLDYFEFRHLSLAQGRPLALLGEAVIGARIAAEANLKVGDTLISSSENLFDLAGVYPLQMSIVGILKPTATADDGAIFVDIRTSWIMAGLGHGHEDLATTDDSSILLERNNNKVVANAKLRLYNRITPANRGSFHFHGEQTKFPLTAALVVPNAHKSMAILLGRYQVQPHLLQLIQPLIAVTPLIRSMFQFKNIMNVIVSTAAMSTLLTFLLVMLLSIRLRKSEINTIFRLGCSRTAIIGFMGAEIVILVAASLVLAASLFFVAQHYVGDFFMRLLI